MLPARHPQTLQRRRNSWPRAPAWRRAHRVTDVADALGRARRCHALGPRVLPTRPKPSRRISKLRFHSQLFSPEVSCAEKRPNTGPSTLVPRGHCLGGSRGWQIWHHENGHCRCRRGSPAPHVWRHGPRSTCIADTVFIASGLPLLLPVQCDSSTCQSCSQRSVKVQRVGRL